MPSNDDHQQSKPRTSDSASAPQLCRDPLSQTSVFLAPRRGERPIELGESADASSSSAHARCPFCSGNEQLAPPDVLRIPRVDAWQARIVPNRYPVVGDPSYSTHGNPQPDSLTRPAVGMHEVLIESPHHDTRVEQVHPATWAVSWQAAWQRMQAFADRPELRWAMLFKNAGARAGASLAHVHSQLVALDFVPPVIREKTALLEHTPTLHQQVLDQARSEGRLWAEEGGLAAFVPAAPRQPFESCLMPLSPEAHFHHTSPETVAAIATLTHRYTTRLASLTESADYNWWLHQAAFDTRSGVPGWRWHLEIMPRLTQLAGFELGTGCHITTMPPLHAATLLRGD